MENISKLTPILYAKNETNFNHNGLGKLTTLLIYEIDEVLNGEFEALFEYPANASLADKIDNELFIKAKPNKKDEPHVFKIYDYELDTVSQTYLIYARSKNIEDLRNNMILDVNVRNQAPTQAWNLAKNNALDPVDITFYSDITTTSSVHWERRNLLSTIAGQEGSMIQYWGGEIKHTIGRVSLFRRRGQDNVTTVRHGKNLEGLTATYSTKGLVTAIVPYYVKNDDKTVYGSVVKSEYVNHYSNTYYDVVEYNDEELGLKREDEPENGWSDSTIKNALDRVAKNWFKENIGKDLPSINMEIALEDISQTKEYEQFKDFEQIEIGDTITVYSKKFNVNINAKVHRVVYNGLTDKNELVEVGTARRSLYDDVRDDFKKIETQLQEGIDHAMTSANGKNTNYHGTADPNEVGLVGQNNDNYFRTNGQFKELWIYRDGMWHLEVGDLTGEQIRAEVEQAQQEIADTKENIDNRLEDLDVELAGKFTDLGEEILNITSEFTHVDGRINTLSETVDGSIQRISNAEGQITQIEANVEGVQTIVAGKADKAVVENLEGEMIEITMAHSTAISQTQKSISQVVTRVDTIDGEIVETQTRIDLMDENINLRLVKKDEIITQINLSEEEILLQADKIQALGDVVVDGKLTITDEFIAPNAQIDGAKIADLTVTGAKIISLDVDRLSGNKAELVQLGFNGINSWMQLDAEGIHMSGSGSYRRTYITPTGFDLYNGYGGDNKAGAIGYFKSTVGESTYDENVMAGTEGSKHTLGIGVNATHNIVLGYNDRTDTNRVFKRALQVDGDTGRLRLYTPISSSGSDYSINLGSYDSSPHYGIAIETSTSGVMFSRNGTKIWDQSAKDWDNYDMTTRQRIGFYGDSGIQVLTNNRNMELWAGGSSIHFYTSNSARKFRISDGSITAWTDLSMSGYKILNQSDIHLKTNVLETDKNSLDKIIKFDFVNFEWLANGAQDFGIIAQQVQQVAPELVLMDEDGYLVIDSTTLNMMTTHAVQQLALREENTNKVASQALVNSEDNQEELERLKIRVEELERKVA